MNTFKKFLAFAGELFFPSFCGICGASLLSPKEAWFGLCDECRKGFVVEETGTRCDLCGRPLVSEFGRCLLCREVKESGVVGKPSFDRLLPLFPYAGTYQALLGAYKFDKSLGVGRFLEEKLHEALGLLPLDEMVNPVLVPVPPRPGKIKKTGWDQIEMLSRFIQARCRQGGGLPVYPCLTRLSSESQKKLNRKNRKTNLRGRIICRRPPPKEAILFDDVITTSSTMEACAAALKAGGAEKVFGIGLFYD
jgi:ComF family protein